MKEQGIPAFHDAQGICHVVLPERGHLKPGMLVVGGDSHSPTGGAFGAYMFGIGATEMAGVLATGEIWLKVPETILIEWLGTLSALVTPKDMMLHACGRLGMDGGRYQAIEYCGTGVEALSMAGRMTLSNMAAELGAQTGLIAPDSVTDAWLDEHGADAGDISALRTDREAVAEHHRFDASALAPQVAAPHSPANAAPVDDCEKARVDIAYIGACTGAKYEDLAAAASVLKGRRSAPGTELLVAPASKLEQDRAQADGLMAVFEEFVRASCPMPAASAPVTAMPGSARISPAFPRPRAISGAAWERHPRRSGLPRPIRSRPRRWRAALPIRGRSRHEQAMALWR